MIATGASISYGGTLVNYLLQEKKDAKIVFLKGIDNEDPNQIWQEMKLDHMRHSVKNDTLSFVISPTREESKYFTMEDWHKLAMDFLRKFDEEYDGMEVKNGKKKDKEGNILLDKDGNPVFMTKKLYANLLGSQILCVLHSDSGTMHLQMAVNRIDRSGHVNSDSNIGKRAANIANMIAMERNMIQAEKVGENNRNKMEADIRDVLAGMPKFNYDEFFVELKRRGYEARVKRNSKGIVCGWSLSTNNRETIYKASEIGKGRKYAANNLLKTWQGIRFSQDEKKRKAEAEEVKKYKFVLTPDNMRKFERHISGYSIRGNIIDPGGRERMRDMPKDVGAAYRNGSISKADAVLLSMPDDFKARPRTLDQVIRGNQAAGAGGSKREWEVGASGFDENLWYLLSDDMKQAVSRGASMKM